MIKIKKRKQSIVANRCKKFKPGFYFGEKPGLVNEIRRLFGKDCSVVKPIDEDGQIAIFGGSGSGKTSGPVIQTLCRTWRAPFFAIDIKGDLKANYDKIASNRNSKVFSLRGETAYTYDPFEFLRKDGEENLVANVQELANAIIPLPLNVKDPIWIDSARNFLTSSILHFFNLNVDFICAVINIMTTPPSELINGIKKSGTPESKIFINSFLSDETISDSKFLMGISQEITNKLSIFATDPRICKYLVPSKNQIRWSDLETHNIFLSIPEDRLEQYGPVLTMMTTQLVRTLERRPEKYSSEGADRVQILLMLDEFPRLGKIEVMTSAISTLRSKNVTICLVCQSLAQLDAIYGRDTRKILLDNCSYKAVLRVGDYESQKYFSDMAGIIPFTQRSKSVSYDANRKISGYNKHTSTSYRSAIQPNEFAMLNDITLFTPNGWSRVKKTSHYKTDFTTKVRTVATKVIKSVKSFFSSCFTAIKRCFGRFFHK